MKYIIIIGVIILYRKKEKIKKFKLIIILSISIVLILSSVIFISDTRRLNFVEKITKDGVLFVNNMVLSPVNFIKNKIDEHKEQKELRDKYKDLETKIDSYESLLAEKEELSLELEELKKTLDLNNLLSDKKVLNAVVVSRNIDYWHDTVIINKGSKNGVKEGMPVVVGEGLIGKVVTTSHFNSTVKLLTSPNNFKVSVKIKSGNDYAYGLLTGYDSKTNRYKIEGISQTMSIDKDTIVTTTGLGDIFPSGIIIGKVSDSKTDSYDLARIIEVEPSVNFNKFSTVTVVKRNVDQ